MDNSELLIFQADPTVTFATNRFINVPVILQFDDTPLISVVREEKLGLTSEIRIYGSDGTYLAKANGPNVRRTEEGKKAGLVIRNPAGMVIGELDGRTIFELRKGVGAAFRVEAELYTPTGYFVKGNSDLPQLLAEKGPLKIRGSVFESNTIKGFKIGVLIKSDGTIALGAN